MPEGNDALVRLRQVLHGLHAAQAGFHHATEVLESSARQRHRVQERLRGARQQMFAFLRRPGSRNQALDLVLQHWSLACPGHPAVICLLDPGPGRLRVAAAVDFAQASRAAAVGLRIGPAAGDAFAASFCGKRAVSEDLAIDPNWQPVRELALEAGLGACWSELVPGAAGQALGLITAYARQPENPDGQAMDLLFELACLAGLVLEASARSAGLGDDPSGAHGAQHPLEDVDPPPGSPLPG